MDDFQETSCIRCGKIRIFKKKWIEKLDRGSVITHIETVCPDNDCQKIVDAQFAAKRELRLAQENRKTGIKV
ncbi:hypothetical protein A3F02_00630 [Candidatus Curtissbacteria bacterium RIFCSPHIGHO2_12_FULL_38_9b]|uniref:Uncharacterized protein n=2 Tax=Candidatus Curtissiibacteriota TaxID=1752717 RepID=A0A1F5GXB9_9BACT|nr:MAG: hypothetical protein A3A48_02155 [Candidatus Curtissbacteria bacterium RIFCSPLOWO2_01_FULL_37_9]OGD96511.1 MAG: hypothetical protein A3F02_00630 [Candidatus Curtissbacteria bacterium RIFCSPHIGHO2_12_FULL_38_9b]